MIDKNNAHDKLYRIDCFELIQLNAGIQALQFRLEIEAL